LNRLLLHSYKQTNTMVTNADEKTVLKAVNKVSKSNYGGNVVFRRLTPKSSSGVVKFTLKTVDKNADGSFKTKTGRTQPRASTDVYRDVREEIFKLEKDPSIFVDTIFNVNKAEAVATKKLVVDKTKSIDAVKELTNGINGNGHEANGTKRRYTTSRELGFARFAKLIKKVNSYIDQHPELLEK